MCLGSLGCVHTILYAQVCMNIKCVNCTQLLLYISDSVLDLTDQTDDSEIPIEKTIETAAFCLLLPGAMLDLSSLLAAKRFRYKHGKKEHSLQ